jgi:hypothetical protein
VQELDRAKTDKMKHARTRPSKNRQKCDSWNIQERKKGQEFAQKTLNTIRKLTLEYSKN